jgi:flagellin-like protein
MKDKRAMSEIVTTIIMVVLALVAVAIIWSIVSNLLGDKGAQAAITQKCIDVKLSIAGIPGCNTDGCNITMTRSAGGADFDGLHVVLKSPTDSSKVITVPGNIGQLEQTTFFANITDVTDEFDASSTNKVEVTVYFRDESGVAQNCPSPAKYTL